MKPELAIALILKRWRDWQEVARYQLPHQQEAERENLLKLYMLYTKMKKKRNQEIQTQLSIPTLTSSFSSNSSDHTVKEQKQTDDTLVFHMQPVDYEHYFEYIRMDVETYNELFKLVEPRIKKQFLIKYPIPAHTRLQICLRYLSSGDSMSLISNRFQVASNTVSKVVNETCQALWDVLKDIVFPLPTEEMWKEKAEAFQTQWDFVHCIGAIDKRQLVLQAPVVSDSNYYKKNESLTFFAVADAYSCFSLISIGIEDLHENGINFTESEIGHQLQNSEYEIPLPSKISENGPELPYVLVGNEEFALTNNMLIPYPSNDSLDLPKQVFNYRIGRARKCVDCAFGILTNQWKIFQKKFSTNVANTIKITKAAVCLHNFLMLKENGRPFQDRRYSLLSESEKNATQGCQNLNIYSDSPSEEAQKVRDSFKELFCEDGAILLEWE